MQTQAHSAEPPQVDQPVGHRHAQVYRVRQRAKARHYLHARELASRVYRTWNGKRVFRRFTAAECIEHLLLLITFTALAITGLMQMFSMYLPVALTINGVFGGVDTLRVIHRSSAVAFLALSGFHLWRILNMWFVQRQAGAMLLAWQDVRDLVGMVRYNLNLAPARPAFDRFTVEEKLEYWALVWGTVIMGLTGGMLWFPTIATRFLPGDAIPVARAIHGLEAILAVLSILTWHLYHAVVKERNTSIFTGFISEEALEEAHPLEHQRLLSAVEFVQTPPALAPETQAAPATPIPHATGETVNEMVQADQAA